MYDTGCFSTNGFYPTASSCSSNTSSPDSLKHQRLLATATPSPPNVSHQFFQPPPPPPPQQQYLFDHHRFRFNPNPNNNNNNNNSNSNLNGSNDIHSSSSSSSSTTSSHDQLHLWLAAQSSGQQPQQSSPATVRMISENGPAFPLPLHLPPGHMVQQVLDENGVLTHVIMPQPAPPPPPPPPHHHVHTGYSPSPYNGLYGHPHQYHNPNVYGPYTGDALSYPQRSACNHASSPTNPSQCLLHPSESNNSSTITTTIGDGVNTSLITTNNSTNNHQRHSPVYNTNANSCTTTGGTSHPRTLNISGQKRRIPSSHTNTNSYVNNVNMKKVLNNFDGSDKSLHHHHPPLATHYSPFYSEMVVQPTTEPVDLAAAAEYDKERQTIEKCLSKLSPPIIQDIESRSALVRIQPPTLTPTQSDYSIDFTNLIYELLLSDKGKDAKYKQVYCGDANEITLKDLKPATEYHLKVCACIDSCKGEYIYPVPFTTEQCEPDRPLPPKLLGSRLKNSLTLKWTAANDNGSKILNYILEYDEGKGREFVEIYRGVKKQYLLNKLTPATFYGFRLAAENSIGRSEFSDTIQFSTLGTIPPEPDPPMLCEKGVKYLALSWTKRPIDETFTLQMNDESNYFRNKYTGSSSTYTVTDLYRNTEYKFRLSAHNQEGQSNYSPIATYRTLPDRPDPPAKPRIKGQIQATQCRVVWDPPRDNGGAEIQQYHLELEESKGFHVIYNGLDTEYLLEQLIPGHSYSLRLSCSSIGGPSDPSDITQIRTTAVAPASCHPPKISGKPKANSLHLRWAYPDYDGGSSIIDFEVQVTNPDSSSRIVYRGRDLDCTVAGLLPGRPYIFQVRAFNRAGGGPWSEYLDVLSGPGVPEAPRNFVVECQSCTSALIRWEEGVNNGAAITEYRLEWSRKENDSFMQLYCGTNCTYEAKGLIPVTHYFFRVQAVNTAGPGSYSMLASCVTPAAPPSIVTSVKVHAKSTSMAVTWKQPSNNGSPITGYYIDIGEKELIFVNPELIEYNIDEVLPDTIYKIRIRAVNTIGPGPFSSTVKCQTKSLPPDPPRLECIAVTCNSIKLKWNNGTVNHALSSASSSSESTTANPRSVSYIIEMEGKDGNYNCIYTGTTYSHKINKLQENTQYNFRICAKNDSGAGPWSDIYTFTTTKAPPNALKAPNINEITSTSCVFNWQAHKSLGNDPISYILQLQIYRKENEYTEIYHGDLTSYRATNLEAGVDYRVRICAIRSTSDGLTLNSPFSPATHFVLPRPEDLAASISGSKASNNHLLSHDHHSDQKISFINRYRLLLSRKLKSIELFESRTLTDQQWAIVIFVGFTLLAIFIAILANFMYSKYNNGSSIPVDNTFSSSSSSFSPGIKK
ncbi:unnamed protein product [Rotaria socialis]|uniref:Fibronectin type-III domain-containing protein n=1 Tax=Rotaria socialis TaxID=392032 RepID=A0A819ZTS7_9BILA|nr:unnamed protein product [Rotaria socialis]CAF3325045.1 unnamed protein product [Rotaria socialis]CAF3509063.1 unnamed protein product [Rotaria socialis]CAF4168121.1 unnamed protein product [Rotaria socialis]CAF4452381.1 unnamed protein product [Rotaria socialis]